MQERTDVGQNVQGQDDAEQEDTGQDGFRTGRMQDRTDAGQGRCVGQDG